MISSVIHIVFMNEYKRYEKKWHHSHKVEILFLWLSISNDCKCFESKFKFHSIELNFFQIFHFQQLDNNHVFFNHIWFVLYNWNTTKNSQSLPVFSQINTIKDPCRNTTNNKQLHHQTQSNKIDKRQSDQTPTLSTQQKKASEASTTSYTKSPVENNPEPNRILTGLTNKKGDRCHPLW